MDLNNLDSSRNHFNESGFLVSSCKKCVRYGGDLKKDNIAHSFKQDIQILWQPKHYDTVRDQTDKATTFSNTYLNPYCKKELFQAKHFGNCFYRSKVMREYVKRN